MNIRRREISSMLTIFDVNNYYTVIRLKKEVLQYFIMSKKELKDAQKG